VTIDKNSDIAQLKIGINCAALMTYDTKGVNNRQTARDDLITTTE